MPLDARATARPTPGRIARAVLALAMAAACAACAGGARYATRWDGRRGYDGNGDYGYDLAASQAEAGQYRARVAADYPEPGSAADPWGPYVAEAAARFQVPPRWIREVMRQESGGHQYDSSGGPITSSAGAMGLMQVMPHTYDMLRQRYGLGADPYDPHDNILAGTAYIHEMYQIYGSPGFLAAYNAGPDRLDSYLSGGGALPDETVQYLASVAPRLGSERPASGPLAAYARGGSAQTVSADVASDPADRAFDGGGLVTAQAPTGSFVAPAMPVAVTAVMPSVVPVVTAVALVQGPAPITGSAAPFARTQPVAGWGIQVGAFPNPERSRAVLEQALAHGGGLLAGAASSISPVERGGTLYRARLVGLSAANATAACFRLSGQGMPCLMVPPGS